jgi:hypothetical protein
MCRVETAMCRVESYIGVIKSHGRVGMLNADVTLRCLGDEVLDFRIKRNFTWYSQKGLIGNTTAHDLMQPVFDNILKNVCIPFGSRIISPIPREHNLVRGSSFGDGFVEGIYLHVDSNDRTARGMNAPILQGSPAHLLPPHSAFG